MPKSILVVDNEFRSRKNIAQFLREEGYEVDEADDGVGALDLLEKKNFDLLICDILMPRLSAFDIIDNHTHNGPPRFACAKRTRRLALFHKTLQPL